MRERERERERKKDREAFHVPNSLLAAIKLYTVFVQFQFPLIVDNH